MINPYLLSFVFSLFLIPSIVFAQEKIDYDIEKLYSETQLQPLEGSSYTGEFVAVTKNNNGDLVSVIYGDVYAYLPHPIFEYQLNKFSSSFVTIDGVDYKKWKVWTYKTHIDEKAIHGSELKADISKRGDEVVILRMIHASIVVEKNDTTDYFVTILKRLV